MRCAAPAPAFGPLNGLAMTQGRSQSVYGQLADFTWAHVRSTHICLGAVSHSRVLTLYLRASSRPSTPGASGKLNKEGGPVPSPVGWRRLGMVVVVLGVGAVAKLISEMLSELDRSDAGDPWGPHRKGF